MSFRLNICYISINNHINITLYVIHVLNINTDKDGDFHVRTVEDVLNIWFIPRGKGLLLKSTLRVSP